MPSSLALAFIAATSCAGSSPTARPSAGTARLSDAISAACSRSRLVNDMPIGQPRARAADRDLLIAVDHRRRRVEVELAHGSSTTSIAISFEIDAIGRTASAFFMYSSSPVVRSTADRRLRLHVGHAAVRVGRDGRDPLREAPVARHSD